MLSLFIYGLTVAKKKTFHGARRPRTDCSEDCNAQQCQNIYCSLRLCRVATNETTFPCVVCDKVERSTLVIVKLGNDEEEAPHAQPIHCYNFGVVAQTLSY